MDRKRLLLVYSAVLIILLLILVSSSQWSLDHVEEPDEPIKFASDHEFLVRPDGISALQETYDFNFDVIYEMAIGLTHEALRASDVDAAMGFATDGKIKQLELASLEDDRDFFTEYFMTPVFRKEVLSIYPQIEPKISEITSRLDTNTMISLNYLVDIKERDMHNVARDWLIEEGLVEFGAQPSQEGKAVRVGASEFVKHRILASIVINALQAIGVPVEDHTQAFRFDHNRERILNEVIDMYWVCTRIERNIIFEEDILAEYSHEEAYAWAVERDIEKGLIWLDYAPYSNSRTILMKQEQAAELGITSISEFVDWASKVQRGD